MNKISIVVHGGAGPDSDYIRKNEDAYKQGLSEAADAGYQILDRGGTALDAVEAAVKSLEDNPLFNAGRGSALNNKAEIEMEAAIMGGHNKKSGAVAVIKNVKNPVALARAVMEKTKHIYLGGKGAIDLANEVALPTMPDAYFVTDHALEQFLEASQQEKKQTNMQPVGHGTVGAVALDASGNLAAATSTGGTENKHEGRIGDSSIIGTGTYADNATCAVSATGDGEYLIPHQIAFHVSALMRYKNLSLQEAAKQLLWKELGDVDGDIGFIGIDRDGSITMEFNSERMHRAWIHCDGTSGAEIYPS